MLEKGFIDKVIAYKRYYLLSSFEGEHSILFFEELSCNKFINGDILTYEIVETKEFGKCALNPKKIGNIYLNKLKKSLDKGSTIEAYVYEKNEGGYLVSYNGYKCFLPNIENLYKGLNSVNNLENTYQIFNVKSIEDKVVILSRKSLLKDDHKKLKHAEISSLKSEFIFAGKVKSVEGFGVFINYKYSDGLLHISNILSCTTHALSKKEIQAILRKVFVKGREILVKIERINDNQYSVTWDKNVEPNREICNELNTYGLET